jgi:hypothetical protein
MRKLKVFLLLILFLSSAYMLNAQISSRETGSIVGVVTDEQGNPLPGATITVTGPALMGKATNVTRSGGEFRIILLPPGQYTLVAELQGFTTIKQEAIDVRLGSTVTIDIKMPAAKVAEEITVVGAAPAVDVKASKTEQIFKSDLLQNLPIARNLASIITLTPGTVSSMNVKGSTAGGNIYQIDGVAANDSCQAQLSIPVDFNLMEEVEVMTGGMPAEVGVTMGGFVNVITKSGGNKYSGQLQFYYTNKDMAKPVLPLTELSALGISSPSYPKYDRELSASFGGPILKDKLWFYLDGHYAGNLYRSNFIGPYTSPYDGTVYNNFDRSSYNWSGFLKLTYQLTKSLKFSLMGNMQKAYMNTRASWWNMPAECQYHDDPWANYASTGVLNWVIDQNTFFELRGGWSDVDTDLLLYKPELTNVPYMYDVYTGYYFGTGYRPNEYCGRPLYQLSAHLTRFLDDFVGGNHELKAGVEVQVGDSKWATWKNNYMEWPWYDGSPYYYGAQGYDRATYGDGWIGFTVLGTSKEGCVAEGDWRRIGFYLQDSMTIQNRLTINIGARFDHIAGWIPDFTKDRTGGGDLPLELGATFLQPVVGFNPYDTFSEQGVSNLIKWSKLSPRIGLTYDIFGNGKTAIKAHYGIYSENIWGSVVYKIHPLQYKEYYFGWWDDNGNGTPDAPSQGDSYVWYDTWTNPVELLRDNWIKGVAPGIKSPYDEQINVGIEHELFKNLKVGVGYIYKSKKNIIDDVLYDLDSKQSWYNPNQSPGENYWVPFTTTVPAVGTNFPATKVTMWFLSNDAPANWILRVDNVPEAFRKYSGFEFTFDKRFADGWQLGGSLNLSKNWGNFQGGYGDIHGYTSAANDANWFVNWGGRTNEDYPVVIKLFGSFNMPYGILGSFYYQYRSGTPWARGVTIVPPAAWAAANNVNPYNTYYVSVETQGTRRYYTSQNLDARLEKSFDIKGSYRIGVFVDVFNLLGNHYLNIGENPGGTWMPVDNDTDQGTYSLSGSYKRITGISGLTRTFRASVRFSF